MIVSYKKFWHQLFVINDTASRADYWWPVIINYVIGVVVIAAIQSATGHSIEDIYTFGDFAIVSARNIGLLIVEIAGLTVSIRRLHDTNRSGWWWLLKLIPLVGTIWFFILMVLPSKSRTRWS